jgi:hypothetical protein
MRTLITFSFALLVVGADAASAAPCMPWVRTLHGQTVDGHMTVRSGKRCTITFRSGGPTETTVIIQRPSNGTVTLGGVGRVTYQSRAGFVGRDTFVMSVVALAHAAAPPTAAYGSTSR